MKKYFALIFLFIFTAFPAFAQEGDFQVPEAAEIGYEKAEVVEVDDFSRYDEAMGQSVDGQKVKVRILGGEHAGELHETETVFLDSPSDVKVKKGETIIMQTQQFSGGDFIASIFDRYRIGWLIAFIILFLVLLAIIGGKQGIKAIISLLVSIGLIWWVLIPGILRGWNALWLTIGLSIIITFFTLVIISGFKKKTYAAILGTLAGVIVATILAVIFGKLAQLTGLASNEAHSLFHINRDLNFENILFASITIGALGAIMDVGISVASAVSEVRQADQKISFKKLFRSGMNVGKDVMGTMSNTLIFAYVGSALAMVLLFATFDQPVIKLLNFNFIADEIIRAMAGSIGLIGAIPLTAFIAAYLESRKKEEQIEKK
ncbi:YibE/F family protein [Patescibacteria group bacterium]|nr:YibE/F family protein [Patescibacteria group bacterium]MBU1673276.1 YibE/F family protein [Patescibacteria group bacterium]MBU1964084.1 YibE/F family protein [Patescibacteria group bacterium]